MIRTFVICAVAALAFLPPAGQNAQNPDPETFPFAPRRAIAYRAASRPVIDGRLDEPGWRNTTWSDCFVDIEGDRLLVPDSTRA